MLNITKQSIRLKTSTNSDEIKKILIEGCCIDSRNGVFTVESLIENNATLMPNPPYKIQSASLQGYENGPHVIVGLRKTLFSNYHFATNTERTIQLDVKSITQEVLHLSLPDNMYFTKEFFDKGIKYY